MNWLYDMKTGRKVLLTVGILCAAIVAVGVIGLHATSNVANITKTLYEQHMTGLLEINAANANMLYALAEILSATRFLLDADKASREKRLEEGERLS